MRRQIACFAANSEGSAALEYSLIAAGLAIAFLAAFLPFGGEMRDLAGIVTSGIAEIISLTEL